MQTLIFYFRGGVKAVVCNTHMPVSPAPGTYIMFDDGELLGCAFEVVRVYLKPDRGDISVQAWRQEIQVVSLRDVPTG